MSIFSCCNEPTSKFSSSGNDQPPLVIDINGKRMIFPGYMDRHEAMQIALMFSQNEFRTQEINLFATSYNLNSSYTDDDGSFTFSSNLFLSEWSREFIHGSSMLPGLNEGINMFLQSRNETLWEIKKIRFKQIVTGDVKYTISQQPSSLEQNAHIVGSFVNTEGKVYYYYGVNVPHVFPQQFTTNNILCNELLLSELTRTGITIFEQEITCQQYPLHITFKELGGEYYTGYKEILEKNPGFFWSTMADILNTIFQLKTDSSGLVISYEDLKLSNAYTPEKLLDGTCVLTCDMENRNKPIGTKGYGHKVNFKLIDANQQIIATGIVTFYTPNCISE